MQFTQKSIERRYIIYQAIRSLWLMGAIWLLFYRLYMTDQGVGVLDAISFGLGLLAEIPSGALADHFGRKKLTILGIIISALGMSMQGLAHSYVVILIGQMMVTAGWAFSSGADEALFYDLLDYKENTSGWKKLVSKGNQTRLVVTLCSYVVGGYLYTISPRLPFIASLLTILSILTIWRLPETKNKYEGSESRYHQYFNSLKEGVKELGKHGVSGYLPLILIVAGFYYSFGYGLLRPILQTRYNFGASAGAWLLFICGITAFIFQRLQLRFIDKISEKSSMAVIVATTVTALIIGSFNIGKIGAVVILIIYVNEYMLDPLISNGLNSHISSKHRATSLSAAAFLKSLPYVISAPLIGFLNVRGKLQIYLVGMATLSVLSLLIYMRTIKDKQKVLI